MHKVQTQGYGDAAAKARGMSFVITVGGTTHRSYARTEEIAQTVAAKLLKLPKKCRPGAVQIQTLETAEVIALRTVEDSLKLRKYEDVICPSCHAPRAERCRGGSNRGATSAHAARRRNSKDI